MNNIWMNALRAAAGSSSADRNAYADELTALWSGNIVSYVPLWECVGSPYAEDYAGSNDGLYSSTGVTLAQDGIGDGRTSAKFNGTTGYVNMYTAGLASAFNGAEGTVSGWFKVSAAEWTDGAARVVARLAASSSNQILIIKSSVNGRFEYTYTAGGTQKQYRKESTSNTTWCSFALTWSKSNNRVRCYFNGAQVGSTLTGLGTWVGALDPATANIGATSSSSVSNCWKGNLAHVVILDREATAAEIAAAHTLPIAVGTSVCVINTPATYSVASGGDIPAAIAQMRGGDILELEAGGTYTFGAGTRGIADLPSGFAVRYTRVIGNGATVTGGEYNIYIAGKSYLSFENINCSGGQFWNAFTTNSNHIKFTDCDFYNPATGSSFDCWRADNANFVDVLRCTAHSTTDFDATRAHDGFELWGPCADITFTDCTAYNIKNGATEQEGHGFEVYGQLAGELCQRITMTNCEAYNCQVGFSCEGGPLSLAHVDVTCDGCSSHDNAFYDYQGIQGSTLYIENHTGGTTNGSVTILS